MPYALLNACVSVLISIQRFLIIAFLYLQEACLSGLVTPFTLAQVNTSQLKVALLQMAMGYKKA